MHPDLLPPLGRLISQAAARTQVIAVSHAGALIDVVAGAAADADAELTAIELVKEFGETRVRDSEPFDSPPWAWPKR